jgi:hypothetical protein
MIDISKLNALRKNILSKGFSLDCKTIHIGCDNCPLCATNSGFNISCLTYLYEICGDVSKEWIVNNSKKYGSNCLTIRNYANMLLKKIHRNIIKV